MAATPERVAYWKRLFDESEKTVEGHMEAVMVLDAAITMWLNEVFAKVGSLTPEPHWCNSGVTARRILANPGGPLP